MQYFSIKKEEWDKNLSHLVLSHTIFATISNGTGQDYELIEAQDIARIAYNLPKPATPLKTFFLPVKENVTSSGKARSTRIIIGIPNCDIEGLGLLDAIYLDADFTDLLYRERRENTLLISTDCYSTQEHCHCTSYNIKPYSERNSDIALGLIDDIIIFRAFSDKGIQFLQKMPGVVNGADDILLQTITKKHNYTESILESANASLPGYKATGELVRQPSEETWDKYSSHCVSCGACSAICPTCTCFLLIDKPGFEKIKQLDTCQYPGFERVAGGEDALSGLKSRFRNRYMCKYLWKPQKFDALACTGCGRCIEACIGGINKNEIFLELSNQHVHAKRKEHI